MRSLAFKSWVNVAGRSCCRIRFAHFGRSATSRSFWLRGEDIELPLLASTYTELQVTGDVVAGSNDKEGSEDNESSNQEHARHTI